MSWRVLACRSVVVVTMCLQAFTVYLLMTSRPSNVDEHRLDVHQLLPLSPLWPTRTLSSSHRPLLSAIPRASPAVPATDIAHKNGLRQLFDQMDLLISSTVNRTDQDDVIRSAVRLAFTNFNNDLDKAEEELTALSEELERFETLAVAYGEELKAIRLRRQLEPAVLNISVALESHKRSRSSRSAAIDNLEPKIFLDIHDEHEDGSPLPTWQRFQNVINQYEMYTVDAEGQSPLLDDLLTDLRKAKLVKLKPVDRNSGTQLHLVFKLDTGAKALFKPKRVSRDFEKSPDIGVYHDIERHIAEIAAFHLDRVLGFRRVPPATLRVVDMLDEIEQLNGEAAVGEIYKSRAGNICFDGMCDVGCDGTLPVCGDGRQLEGAMIAYVPLGVAVEIESPWIRSCENCSSQQYRQYRKHYRRDVDYCDHVRRQPPFNHQRLLLHLIDAHIFDFLIGNMDRHHFEMFQKFGNNTFFPLFDNGKGFGSAENDEVTILAPLYQCCVVRLSTVDRLLSLHTDTRHRLSDVMRRSLRDVTDTALLTERHLAALDRRLGIVLAEIDLCLRRSASADDVIIDDGV